MDNHYQIDNILLDFIKAFDKVPHRRLLTKLLHYGIRGYIHKWIEIWLTQINHNLLDSLIIKESNRLWLIESPHVHLSNIWSTPGYCLRPSYVLMILLRVLLQYSDYLQMTVYCIE